MSTPSPRERAESMCRILEVSDADLDAAKSTTDILSKKLGPLMSTVTKRLVRGEGVEMLFGDDEALATTFKNQLTQFVLKATVAEFSDGYCEYVANFAERFEARPPMQAFQIVFASIAEWLVKTVNEAFSRDEEARDAAQMAWQKLSAVNFDLLLSAYEEKA